MENHIDENKKIRAGYNHPINKKDYSAIAICQILQILKDHDQDIIKVEDLRKKPNIETKNIWSRLYKLHAKGAIKILKEEKKKHRVIAFTKDNPILIKELEKTQLIKTKHDQYDTQPNN